ncbi:hypothetical protein DICVIV_00045 [Dictyocaulus viviparus]|uniref:Uncharacterized protein n=1 Tax=Dictyocaulus viviparus TaxID=29172 RepID=A0A0D8YBN1_DICVI|nr:hypothetical protein DICVIV_00045 [Dictyocaulus viviparus]
MHRRSDECLLIGKNDLNSDFGSVDCKKNGTDDRNKCTQTFIGGSKNSSEKYRQNPLFTCLLRSYSRIDISTREEKSCDWGLKCEGYFNNNCAVVNKV